MEDKDLYWLAGLLEGEGCFYFDSGMPVIQVAMTDEDVIQRASILMGVSVVDWKPKQEHHKHMYRARLRGKRAMALMKVLQPLMGIRRSGKIDEMIAGYSKIHADPISST